MKRIYGILLCGSLVAVAACGNSLTGTVTQGSASATSSDTASGSATANVVGSSVAAGSGDLDQSQSVKHLKAVAKAAKAYAVGKVTTDFNEDIPPVSCTTSGSVSGNMSGTVTADVDSNQQLQSITFDVTSTMSFNECVETATLTASDDSTCTLSAGIDGDLSCPMTGSLTGDTVDFDFACATTSSCEGMTVTIGGTAHTVGISLAIAVSGDINNLDATEPTVTGSLCIDGDTFNIADLEDAAADLTAAELGCE